MQNNDLIERARKINREAPGGPFELVDYPFPDPPRIDWFRYCITYKSPGGRIYARVHSVGEPPDETCVAFSNFVIEIRSMLPELINALDYLERENKLLRESKEQLAKEEKEWEWCQAAMREKYKVEALERENKLLKDSLNDYREHFRIVNGWPKDYEKKEAA